MKRKVYPIYFPFERYQWVGGPATFMVNLQKYLEQHNFFGVSSIKKAKVFFCSNSYPVHKIEKVKRLGGYVIQRLGGTYYPSKHGEKYIELNRETKTIYLKYADAIIFQNQYCRDQCFAMFGEREDYRIIVNGADTSIFYPAQNQGNTRIHGKIKFVTTGRFRNIDMIEPVVKALDMLKDQLDFELTVVGPVVNSVLEPYFRRPYIRHIEMLPLPEIAESLRNSHLFIYSHLNPPCPNSVVEAVSCGIPIVGFNSGAMAELCFFSKDLLAYVSDEVFQKYEDFDAHKLAEKIILAVEHYDHYREIALAHSYLYSFEECGQQYLDVFQRYLNKRRKLLPYVTYLFKRGLKKIQRLPDSLKYRLLKGRK